MVSDIRTAYSRPFAFLFSLSLLLVVSFRARVSCVIDVCCMVEISSNDLPELAGETTRNPYSGAIEVMNPLLHRCPVCLGQE